MDTNSSGLAGDLESRAVTRALPVGHDRAGADRIVWRTWGSGSGRPHAVLLHGSAGSWTHWIRNIDALAATHTVHAADLPNSGDSSAFTGGTTLASMAHAVRSTLDTLLLDEARLAAPAARRRASGGESSASSPASKDDGTPPNAGAPFDLIGFSFGSVLAEEMALMRPERVRSVVLVRGSFDGLTPGHPPTLVRWRHLTDPSQLEAAHRHNLAALMFADPANIDALAVQLHARNSQRSTLNPMPFATSRTPNALQNLAVPVHAITGEFDCLAGSSAPFQRETLLKARPDASFQAIAGAGHWAPYEAADAFNAALRIALARTEYGDAT